jgi:hypothetical protein
MYVTTNTNPLDPKPIGSKTHLIQYNVAKRPRILEDEVIVVMRAIHHRYAAMEPVEDQAEAAALYRVLWRLKENRRGLPHHPRDE